MLDKQKHSYKLREKKDSSKQHSKNKTSHKANKERLSRHEILELMGVYRETYYKCKGRVKQR